MRLFFIPGFGEDEFIFDKIKEHISGEKIFINNWKELGDQPIPNLNVILFAKVLIKRFDITKSDVVIGHSLGGWIAYHIKHIVGCDIVQIASWTDNRKVVRPVSNANLVYWFIRRGWYFNPLVKKILIWKGYKNKPSEKIFAMIFDRLSKGNKENIINQLRLIFTPINEVISVSPDLRIHARNDSVVIYPDEKFIEVPGDHFTLYTHPQTVYEPIAAFLNNKK